MAKKDVCMCGHHHGHGWKMLAIGALVLANAYWPFASWPVFIGGLAVIKGIWMMCMPCKCK
jgi:hypothetical protein